MRKAVFAFAVLAALVGGIGCGLVAAAHADYVKANNCTGSDC